MFTGFPPSSVETPYLLEDQAGQSQSYADEDQDRRKARLLKECASWGPRAEPTSRMHFVLADTRHHVIYAEIPKVSATNWLYVLINLTGKVHVDFAQRSRNRFAFTDRKFLNRIGLTYVQSLPSNKVQQVLKNYYKFIFVRHPFTRILAAYRNKLNPGVSYYHQRYGREILKLFRKNASSSVKTRGTGTTFAEFVQYIIYLWKTGRNFDEHWQTFHKLTFPCQISYDFIGKIETLDADAAIVLRDGFHLNYTVTFPKETREHKTGSTAESTRKAFEKIPEEHINVLRRIYHYDFLLFGYDKNSF